MRLSPTTKLFTVSLICLLWVGLTQLLWGLYWPSFWSVIVRFSAVFPAIWVGYETTRLVRGLDELQQRIALETLSFSFANTMLVLFAIGLWQLPWGSYFNLLCMLPVSLFFGCLGLWLARRRYQ